MQQQDLFETDDNIQLDDSPVDFEKKPKGLNDLNNTLEVELKILKYSVKEL